MMNRNSDFMNINPIVVHRKDALLETGRSHVSEAREILYWVWWQVRTNYPWDLTSISEQLMHTSPQVPCINMIQQTRELQNGRSFEGAEQTNGETSFRFCMLTLWDIASSSFHFSPYFSSKGKGRGSMTFRGVSLSEHHRGHQNGNPYHLVYSCVFDICVQQSLGMVDVPVILI